MLKRYILLGLFCASAWSPLRESFSQSTPDLLTPWQDDYQTALAALKEKNFSLSISILSELLHREDAKSGKEGILYHLGLSYYGLANYKAAIEKFDSVISSHPESSFAPRSMYWKGESLYSQKNLKDAVSVLGEFAGRYSKDEYTVKAHYTLGEIFRELGQEENEINNYSEALEKYPNHELIPYVHLKLGKRLFERGDYKKSISVLRDLILNSKMDSYAKADLTSDAEIMIGRCFTAMKDFKSAQKHLENFIAKFPSEKEKTTGIYFLGLSYLKNGDIRNAVSLWKKIREKYPKNEWSIESYFSESSFYKKNKEYGNSIGILESVISAGTGFERTDDIKLELSVLYKKTGERTKARQLLTSVSESKNEEKRNFALFNLAEEDEESNPEKAIEYYEKIIGSGEKNKYVPDALYGKAKALHKKKEYKSSIEIVNSLLEDYPDYKNSDYARILRADCLSLSGKHADALKEFNKLISSKDKTVRFNAKKGIAWVYFEMKMYARSDGEFAKLLHSPDLGKEKLSEVHQAIGITRMNLKQYSKAKESFKAILFESSGESDLSKLKEDAQFKLALIEFREGNFSDSLFRLKKIILSKPETIDPALLFYQRGLCEEKLNMFPDAIESFSQAIVRSEELNSHISANSYYRRGLVRLKSDSAREAIADLQHAVSLNEEISDDSQFEICSFYLKADTKKAESEFSILKDKFPKSPYVLEFYFLLADKYRFLKEDSKADSIYEFIEKKYESDKKSDTVLYLLAENAFKTKKYEETKRHCNKYLKLYPDYDKSDDCLFKLSDVAEAEKSAVEKLKFLEANKSLFHESRKYDYVLKLAEAYIKMKESRKAEKFLSLIPEKDKNYSKRKYFEGFIYDEQGNSDRAYPLYAIALSSSETEFAAKSLARLGRFDLISKNYNNALKHYSRIIYQYSAYYDIYAEALFFLAVAYDRTNDSVSRDKMLAKLKKESSASKFSSAPFPNVAAEIPYR